MGWRQFRTYLSGLSAQSLWQAIREENPQPATDDEARATLEGFAAIE